MNKYGVTMEAAAGAATEEIGDLSVTTTIPRRIGVYDFILGSEDTPTDIANEWIIQRHTDHNAGRNGSAILPKPLDPGDPVAQADAGQGTYTIAVSVTTAEELIDMGLNLRATFRWVAAPDGEMIVPATDNNGLTWICNSSGTENQKVTVHFNN